MYARPGELLPRGKDNLSVEGIPLANVLSFGRWRILRKPLLFGELLEHYELENKLCSSSSQIGGSELALQSLFVNLVSGD